MIRILIVGAILILAMVLSSFPCLAQCIVYGDSWAAMFSPLEGWESKCHGRGKDMPDVMLWPSKSNWADAPTVMYVRSSGGKKEGTLDEFAVREFALFKKEYPDKTYTVSELPPLQTADKRNCILRKITGDKGFNPEVVAYVEGLNVRLTVVVSSRSEAELAKALTSFQAYVQAIAFMTVPIENGAKPPN